MTCWPLWNICVTIDHEYVPLVVSILRSFPRSWLITGFVTRLTRRVSLVEQELVILPEHLSSPLAFSGARVTRSLVLCVCFVDRCLSFCLFSFGHCVVCSSSIYEFWLPLLVSSNSSYRMWGERVNLWSSYKHLPRGYNTSLRSGYINAIKQWVSDTKWAILQL